MHILAGGDLVALLHGLGVLVPDESVEGRDHLADGVQEVAVDRVDGHFAVVTLGVSPRQNHRGMDVAVSELLAQPAPGVDALGGLGSLSVSHDEQFSLLLNRSIGTVLT